MKISTLEDLKKAHHILNSIQEACLEVSSNSVIAFANKRAEELFGRKKNNLVGRYIWEVFSEPLHTVGIDAINKALVEKISSNINYSSSSFKALTSLRVIAIENGAIILIHKKEEEELKDEIGWRTEKARTEEALQQSEAKVAKQAADIIEREKIEEALRRSEKLKDEFIGIASHELKTPVTSIKAYAQMLHMVFQEKGDNTSAVYIEKINTQVNRLTDLIKSLLDTTKIAEGQLPLNPESFDLNKLIAEHIGDLQYISEKHRLVFTPGEIRLITADRDRIGQVLTNLISNAIKYSPEGGDVDIISQSTEDGVRVTVSDKGIGIPPEVKDKVFDRFFRVMEHRITSLPGMGLGLYITAGIIHRHGGTISVESEVGKGSTFSFILPYQVEKT